MYDRLEHKKSMNRITKKIEKCTEAKKEKSDGTTSDDETPDEDPSLKDKKKLLYKKHSQARSVSEFLIYSDQSNVGLVPKTEKQPKFFEK